MSRRNRIATVAIVMATALALADCGSDDDPESESTPPTSTAATAERTPELDAIGVIGHSGATGADSNGDGQDVRANSWATGDNQEVHSVYLRLLAGHPALEGNNDNNAISGSDLSSLMGQATALLANDPVPDIVLVQSIDNDIRCDGTDEANFDPFEAGIEEVITYLQTTAPGIKVFFVDQWASVDAYDGMAQSNPDLVQTLSGSGPCDTFTPEGQRKPEAEAYLQGLVDEYFKRIVHVCAQHPGCATDEGAMQALRLEPADVTEDFNHLTVSGQAKMAAIVWEQLPPAWK
jgi:hypothetical protein